MLKIEESLLAEGSSLLSACYASWNAENFQFQTKAAVEKLQRFLDGLILVDESQDESTGIALPEIDEIQPPLSSSEIELDTPVLEAADIESTTTDLAEICNISSLLPRSKLETDTAIL